MAKFNLYKIDVERKRDLKVKLKNVGLVSCPTKEIDGFTYEFYYSSQPDKIDVWWASTYRDFIPNADNIKNTSYYGLLLISTHEICYAVSLGKTHFYLKQFCDLDFGLDLAERIANHKDVSAKHSKFYQSTQNKAIVSFKNNSELDYDSGESTHFLKSSTIDKEKFGKTVSFGQSVLFSLDIEPIRLKDLILSIENELKEKPKFPLTRLEVVKDTVKIAELDSKLIYSILDESDSVQTDYFSLSGVNFIFNDEAKFTFYIGSSTVADNNKKYDELSFDNLKEFLSEKDIDITEKLNYIRIKIYNEDSRDRHDSLKNLIDFVTEDNYCLMDGKWYKFNNAYIEFLEEEVDKIQLDLCDDKYDLDSFEKEDHFIEKRANEGYHIMHKDSKTVGQRFKVEDADLYKNKGLFFVKKGIPQRLNYVVDQARNTIQLLQNKTKKIIIDKRERKIKNICLWLILENRKNKIEKLSDLNSLIFLMKLAELKRQCAKASFNLEIKICYRKQQEIEIGESLYA